MPSPHQLIAPRRWAALSAATVLGLACVALLLAGGRASAAPPDVPARPLLPLAGPAPARLAPAAQLTPTICPLDVALVVDNSGSQEWDTICYDCWHEATNDVTTYPYPANGVYYPISYTALISNALCAATSTPYVTGTNRYIIMEAELYARNNSDWHRAARQPGIGYWALQRGLLASDTNGASRSSSIDGDFAAGGSRSAHVAHNPYWTFSQSSPPAAQLGRFYSQQDAASGVAPRLDYDFTPTWSTDTYIWARVQGGGSWSFNNNPDVYTRNANKLSWAVDGGTPVQNASAPTCNAVYDYAGCYLSTTIHDDQNCSPGGNNCPAVWRWIRLGSVAVTSGTLHTLKLWAGSPGYEVDKIVVTNDGNGALGTSTINDVLTRNNGRGRPATVGSARGGAAVEQAGACDPCNPIYGLTVNPSNCTTPYYPVLTTTDRLQDELFGDREPLRGSQEAAKHLVTKMDPQYDQIGFVGFDNRVNEQAELTCLRRMTQLGDVTICYAGPSPISYTYVLQSLENQTASGNTNLGEAMRNGLEVLGYNVDSRAGVDNLCDGSANSACGRGYAARPVMILLTDGSPNANPGGHCADDPSLWPYNSSPDFDCVMYYAQKARQAGVTIYPIGLGNGVIPELLQAVAGETGGEYYWASSPRQLDLIFDAIPSSTTASCSPFGLTMVPDGAQTGLPGQSLVYTHTLTNQGYRPIAIIPPPQGGHPGGAAGAFANQSYYPAILAYTTTPANWPVSVSPISQTLEPGQAVTVTVNVTVPLDSMEGVTHVTRLGATLQGDELISATVIDTTTVGLLRGVDIEPSQAASGLPGQVVTYTHLVTNTGNSPGDFTLSAVSGWPPAWQPPTVSLAAGASTPLTVTLVIPSGALSGDSNLLTVTAVQGDQADPDTVFDVVTDTTTTGLLRGVDVEPAWAASGVPGQIVTYTHVVTNTGNGLAAEVFTISAVSGRWTPTWQPPTMSLAAGASAPLTVTLLIPAGTLSGTLDVLTLTAVSQAAPDTVFDVVTDTITVGESPGIYLPIVLKGS